MWQNTINYIKSSVMILNVNTTHKTLKIHVTHITHSSYDSHCLIICIIDPSIVQI